MHPTHSNCLRPASNAAALSILALVGLVLLGEADCSAQNTGEQAVNRGAKPVAKMVEDLANRNKPPKIVKRHFCTPHYVPLFPEDYDWKEDKRVYNAV